MKRLIPMLVLVFAIVPSFAQAHYSGSETSPAKAVYLLASLGRPNYGDGSIYGGTVGGYMQWKRFIGVDARFADLPSGASGVHQYFYGIGPRVKMDRRRFQIFGSIDGGIGHVQFLAGRQPNGMYHGTGTATDVEYFLSGGVDYSLTRHASVRLGQIDYGSIPVLDSGLNPKIFSAGLVYKFF